jgi:type I restriction enzyme, S subunit
MNEWIEYSIDDIVIDYFDYRGKTPKKLGMDWGGGDIKALSANNVDKGKINFDKECYLASEELYKIWMHKGDCEKGDVLMTMEAPLGNIAQIPDTNRYILSQRTLLFKTKKEKVSNDYLFYVLSDDYFQDELIKNSSGSTVVGIQQKKLAKIKIKLPSLLPEQRKIAKILSTIDAVIEKTQQAIAKYKAIKQGMLHDLFTRGIDIKTGKLRPKYEDAPELYKESKLGWVPKEWDVEFFSNAFDIISGGTPSTHIGEYWNGNIPWLSVDDFNNGKRYVYNSAKKISEAGLTNSATNLLKEDMIIISARGTVGVISQLGTTMAFNQSCYGFNSINKKITNDFGYYFLIHYKTYFGFSGFGSVFSTITRDYFDTLEIAYPKDENETIEIVKKVSLLDDKIETEQAYLYKLQQIKQGLMSDLLSGKKRVKVEEQNLATT